jgi:acetyl-CoA carboxylase biotin carboxylase subunit
LSADLRLRLADAAVALGRRLDYRGAGTVEFLVDLDRDEFGFLEIHTRVQVEHPVTEMVTGVDIVRQQIRLAAGEPLGIDQGDVVLMGHSIECRINAESVADGFLPSPGTITCWEPPAGDHVRVDSHATLGYVVSPHYDSLIAKLIVVGRDRPTAIDAALAALDRFEIEGVETTRDLHRAMLSHDDFRRDAINTRWLETTLLPGFVSAPDPYGATIA